ncbi:MAG: type II toxin-antitoxin system VapC family toxin [Acidobacteriota bacterium]
MRVVDASVALRWYVRASGSDAAVSILEGEDVLVAPDLVVAEVCNSAWKLVRAGEITKQHAARIAAAVPSAFSALVATPRLASRAIALANELDHPVYDCLYLTLAEQETTSVVTADRRLLSKLEGTPWQHLAQSLLP